VIFAWTPLSSAATIYRRRVMDEKEPTQRTGQGYEIPVPTREQVLDDFAKAAQPIPPKPKKRKSDRRKGRAGK
jgi:hypothetical protein